MNNKLSMLEVEVMLHMDWDEMFLPEYNGVNGAEFPHVVAAEITAAEEAAKASIKEVIVAKGAVAARRKATAKKEKQYKAAKAEHWAKTDMMGTRRFNGNYIPYKRGAKILANSIVIEDEYEDNIFEAEDKLTEYYRVVSEKVEVQKELEAIVSAIEFEEAEIKYMKKNYDRIVNPTKWGDDYIIDEIFNGYVESKKPFIEEMKEEAVKLREKLALFEEV